jgi:Zn-dependent protease with chaperone function
MARYSFISLLLISACAGPITRLPLLDHSAVLAEQQRQQAQVVDSHVQMLERLQSIAWPVLKANADICGTSTRQSIGLTLTDDRDLSRQVRGLRLRDVPLAGVMIAAVAAGSPAAAAGLKSGDRLQGKSVAEIGKALNAEMKKSKTATLSKADGSQLKLMPETICASPVRLTHNNQINAYTNGKSLVFYSGLLRAVPDDAQVQMVVAHELAHSLLKHPRKGVVNSIVSGGWLLGTVAGSGGWLVDTLGDLTGQHRPVSYQSLGTQLAAWPYERAFEREADYVALYLMARSGGDIAKVEQLFATFSNASPASTWISISHPITPERVVAVRAARAEIEAKRASGRTLLPEGWPKTEQDHANPDKR